MQPWPAHDAHHGTFCIARNSVRFNRGGDTFEVEGEVPVLEHDGGETGGKSGGLRAQVSINGTGAPAADEFDGVFVDSAAKEGGGAARAET